MSEVKNVEIIQSSLGRWHPGDLAFIERFEYFADFESIDSALKLTALFQRRDTVRGGWPCREGDFKSASTVWKSERSFHQRLWPNPKANYRV